METISMSRKERKRLEVMSQVKQRKLTLVDASRLLGVTYRQVRRIWQCYEKLGDQGLVHGLRGKESNRQVAVGLREQALARYRESYHDYGPTLAAESLSEEQIVVPVSTLRRWLQKAGLWSQQRRSRKHRRRRARREFFGDLVQMDGSHHDWFEGRRGWAVLMVMIDDATSRVLASFFEGETLSAAFEMMQRYTSRHGLPRGLYVDQAGIYRSDREPTVEEILAEKEPETQFGRAMRTLEVELILAHSAQAKGRVERMNGTLQDRLVKALRQRGISDLATANRFLEEEFLPAFNAKFSKPASQPTDVHRPVPLEIELARELAVHEERVVQNDWTVRWRNGFFQLGRDSGVQPGQRVVVVEPLAGRMRLFVGDRELSYGTARTEPQRPGPRRREKRTEPIASSQGQKPSAKHPWRRARVGASEVS